MAAAEYCAASHHKEPSTCLSCLLGAIEGAMSQEFQRGLAAGRAEGLEQRGWCPSCNGHDTMTFCGTCETGLIGGDGGKREFDKALAQARTDALEEAADWAKDAEQFKLANEIRALATKRDAP